MVKNIAVLRAERHANPDLVGSKSDGIGHYAKNADEHEREANSRECANGNHAKLRLRVGDFGLRSP